MSNSIPNYHQVPDGSTLIGSTKVVRQGWTKVNVQDKIGGISRGNRLLNVQQQRERIEQQFLSISFKANRAEAQRNERRAKR